MPNPLIWLGASVGAWIVWSLTSPSKASAAEGLPAPGSRLPAGSGSGPSLPASAPNASAPLLRRGSKGPAVLAWQTTLVYGGFLPDAPASRDSVFGVSTEAATKAFQQKAGVKVDGVVGPETRAAAARLIPGI